MTAIAAAVAGLAAVPLAVAAAAPVQQLPPGLVTLARLATPQGPISLVIHRIRYFGKVSLCLRTSAPNGAEDQSCLNYPLPSTSNGAPVWWGPAFVGNCTRTHFQVTAGIVLRAGLQAWTRTPAGLARMSTATIRRAFGVPGGLLYAVLEAGHNSVTLRDGAGRAIYSAPVAPLPPIATQNCGAGSTSSSVTSIATSPGTIP